MKRYIKEIIIFLIQLFIFYIFPLFAAPTDAIGMVLLIIISTFVLATTIGIISNKKIKYIYPIVVSISFIPSIFIYYNESALIHTAWYLIISSIGLIIGAIIYKINARNDCNSK